MAARPAPPPLAEGTLLKDYRVVRRLGTGSMGEVYEAVHAVIGRRVAIKVLKHGVDEALNASRRLLEEARAVNAIRHPGIVDVFDVGVYGDRRPFLVMELLEGRSLSDRLKQQGKPALDESLHLLGGILEALGAAHRAGVIHRDLKPSNVFLVGEPPGPARVKLLDFGIARRADRPEPLTAPEMALGSVGFMAPEQLQGQAVAASDLYAVGCLAWQLLVGRPVFPLKNIPDAARRHLTEPAPKLRAALPDASALLEAWVDMLLQKDVAQRPRTAEAALSALRAVREDLAAQGGPATEPSLSVDPQLATVLRAHKKTEVVPAFEPPSSPGATGTARLGPVPRLSGNERPTARDERTDALESTDRDKTLLDS